MIIFPAIDISDNKCVRLKQGDFQKVTIYENNPINIAKKWKEGGAEYLHIVDLDGAKDEELVIEKTISNILKNIDIKIQIGGGIRNVEQIENLLSLGVDRVILSSVPLQDMDIFKDILNRFKEKIVVSIDAKDGKVAIKGWTELSDINYVDFAKRLESIGVKTIVFTDISKDGMMSGPNFNSYEILSKETNLDIIASGGISSIEDVKRLRDMNIYGCIIGKALYDKNIDIKEAIKCSLNE